MDKHWDGLGSAALTWEIETARQYPKRSVPSLCRAPLVDHDAASEDYTVIYSGFVVRQVQEPVISQVLIFVKTRTKLRPSRAKRFSKFIIWD